MSICGAHTASTSVFSSPNNVHPGLRVRIGVATGSLSPSQKIVNSSVFCLAQGVAPLWCGPCLSPTQAIVTLGLQDQENMNTGSFHSSLLTVEPSHIDLCCPFNAVVSNAAVGGQVLLCSATFSFVSHIAEDLGRVTHDGLDVQKQKRRNSGQDIGEPSHLQNMWRWMSCGMNR